MDVTSEPMHRTDEDVFRLGVEGLEVLFSLEDDYSRGWFLPRYEGGRLHESAVSHLLLDLLPSSRCFVDVGANLGYYCCLAARRNPACAVYGFEMCEANFRLLERNLALNGCANVQAVRAAVGDKEGSAAYHRFLDAPDSGYRLAAGPVPNQGELVEVEVVTLDGFFQGRPQVPDLVKIDVEGGEAKVLAGMRGLLETARPDLLVEVHPVHLLFEGTGAGAVVSSLRDLGYRIFRIEEVSPEEGGCRTMEIGELPFTSRNVMLHARGAR